MKINRTRVALYIRVSTDKQVKEGESLEAQENALTKYAKENKFYIVDKYIEYGESGQKMLRRTALNRMLDDVKKGKIDMIILTKLDRWFRSVKDFYKVQETLNEFKVDWKTIWEDYDTTSANGRFQLNVMLSLGELEAQRTAERIYQTFDYKYNVQKTVCSGGKKFGWDIVDKKYVINKEEAELRKQSLEKLIETQSISKTVKWYQINVRNISYHSIKRELKDSAVIGDFVNERGEHIADFIPRIVSDEIYYDAQKVFKNNIKNYKNQSTNTNHTYIFSGLLHCGICGFKMTGTRNKKKYYYRCKHSGHDYNKVCSNNINLSEDALELHLLDNIEKSIKDELITITSEKKELLKKKNNIGSIKTKLNKLADLYMNNMVDLDYYKKQYEILNLELETEEEKNKIKAIDTSKLEDFQKEKFMILYRKLDNNGKLIFWRNYIDKITIFSKDNISIKIKVD